MAAAVLAAAVTPAQLLRNTPTTPCGTAISLAKNPAHGNGATLSIQTSGSATFLLVKQLKTISYSGSKLDLEDITNLDSAATGINLLTAIVDDVTATKLRGLLWASLLKSEPDLTLEAVGGMINPGNIGTIHSALLAAWFGSLCDPEDSPKGKPRRGVARHRKSPNHVRSLGHRSLRPAAQR